MAVFNDITSKARMILDEIVQKSWQDTEVFRECNFAYQEYVTAVMTTYEDFYLKTAFFDLVVNKQEYTNTDGIPTDIFKFRRLELNFDFNHQPTAFVKANPMDITQVRDSLQYSGFGAQRVPSYYVYGFEDSFHLGLIPTPTIASPTGGKIWYTPIVVNLVLPTDPLKIPFSDRFASGIGELAGGYLLQKGQQEPQEVARLIANGQAMKQEMIQELQDRVSDESKMITDTVGMNLDFSTLNY